MGKIPCSYTVVRYVPDPLRNEPTNLGVILQCLETGYINCLFTTNLHRKIGGAATSLDINILQAYIDEFKDGFSAFSTYPTSVPIFTMGSDVLESNYLHKLADGGTGKIQFTEPQGSLADNPEDELYYLFGVYVGKEMVALDHQATRSRLKTEIKREFRKLKILAPEPEIKGFVEDAKVKGGRSSIDHLIDFSYTNGKVYLIEIVDMRYKAAHSWVSKTYEAAFKFDDLKRGEDGKKVEPYSVIAVPDKGCPFDSMKILETYSTVFRYTRNEEREDFFWQMQKILEGPGLF